tara:strand:+ start:240571 stop:241203 length:633 start_codon:yes stop_codon:yes gene_type:complete
MTRNIIITGAGGALGSNTVKAFKNNDAFNVYEVSGTDLTDMNNAQAIADQHDEIDVLLNIAGGFTWKEIKDTSFEDFEAQFNMNFKTMYNMTMATLTKIEKAESGRIVNIGAASAITAASGMAAYAASKSAVMRFTEALAAETPDTMTVNALLPSIIDTPTNRNDMPEADFSKWVTVDELISQLIFLVSVQSSGINGAIIPVTGRIYAQV